MSTGNWKNSDGLYLEFGTTKAAVDPAGEYKTYGDFREINVRLDLSTLTSSTSAPVIISNNLRFPSGERIARVDLISDTAITGTSGTLDIGLIKDDRVTELDFNGLISAYTVAAAATVGTSTSVTAGTTYAGALLGTSIAAADGGGYLTANWNTTQTVGTLNIRIFLYGRGTITQ